MVEGIDARKYGAVALDPVHIGAGGYKLGRVDNTVVRDPTTEVPKIPGTSLAGVIRAYSEIAKKEGAGNSNSKLRNADINEIFGTEEKQGVLRFYDGQILFFPVPSIQGTIWITTKELLEYWLEDLGGKNLEELSNENKIYALRGIDSSKPLNLGWLMLEIDSTLGSKEIILPSKLNLVKRIAVISDKLFSQVINDNLEVRTSVRIDPKTGAAKERALYTYEAIPRGTVFGFEIVVDKRKNKLSNPELLVEAALPYLKLLGIGGMVTRGFGRIDVFNLSNPK